MSPASNPPHTPEERNPRTLSQTLPRQWFRDFAFVMRLRGAFFIFHLIFLLVIHDGARNPRDEAYRQARPKRVDQWDQSKGKVSYERPINEVFDMSLKLSLGKRGTVHFSRWTEKTVVQICVRITISSGWTRESSKGRGTEWHIRLLDGSFLLRMMKASGKYQF